MLTATQHLVPLANLGEGRDAVQQYEYTAPVLTRKMQLLQQ